MPDDKKSEATASKRIDPTVEDEDRRPAGKYVKNPIQIQSRNDDGPAVVLKPGYMLKKGDMTSEDVKRAMKSGDLEDVR